MHLFQKLSDILDTADPANPQGVARNKEGQQEVGGQQATTSSPISQAVPAAGSSEIAAAGSGQAGDVGKAVQDTSSFSAEGGACGSKGISEWEVVSAAAAMTTAASRSRSDSTASNATPGELRPRAEDAIAEEAARALRLAASAAEALAPRLPGALRRAEIAEAEVVRLQRALEIAESRIESMEKTHELVTQGFISEIRQRDAEIATYKAASASTASGSSPEASLSSAGAEAVDVVTFSAEGPLGLEFDQSNACLKLIAAVDANSQAEGKVAAGDEVVSINGVPARSLSWEELAEVLSTRPAVVSIRRAFPLYDADPARGPGRLGERLRLFAGWTGAAAVRAVRAAMTDNEDAEKRLDEDDPQMDDMPSEVRNRPFYELVRGSMAEACAQEKVETGFLSGDEGTFETWLRQFHSERDNEWYESNHVRVYNAFKPHWDEVVAAQRAIAAS